jgi:hypothetical protein
MFTVGRLGRCLYSTVVLKSLRNAEEVLEFMVLAHNNTEPIDKHLRWNTIISSGIFHRKKGDNHMETVIDYEYANNAISDHGR